MSGELIKPSGYRPLYGNHIKRWLKWQEEADARICRILDRDLPHLIESGHDPQTIAALFQRYMTEWHSYLKEERGSVLFPW